MDVCCGVEGEIFGGAILARIFGMCNNSIRRLIAFITFPLLHRCSVMRSCFKFQIIGNEFSSLILKCVVEINIINKFYITDWPELVFSYYCIKLYKCHYCYLVIILGQLSEIKMIL